MGCGASKKDVVDTDQKGNKSPPPEKAPPNTVTAEPAKTAVVTDDKHSQDTPQVPPTNPTPAQEAPKPASPPPPSDAPSHPPPAASPPPPAATAHVPNLPPAAEHKKADDHKPEHKEEVPHKESRVEALPPIGTSKKATLIEIDLGAAPPSPHGGSKSAVQERLERYANDQKVGVLRPSSASLERRMADADSRRKQQADQKVKKAKYTNELAKDKYSELREAEEKKTQELMLLIKNKNIQAASKRTQIQQEVKAKAEEDVIKARELSARKKEGGSTPHTPKTPHSPTSETPISNRSATDDELADKSILEVPLPPLK